MYMLIEQSQGKTQGMDLVTDCQGETHMDRSLGGSVERDTGLGSGATGRQHIYSWE